jgi:hypothetical protein
MKRFDLVVATCGRIEVFWEALQNLKAFARKQDRIIILDCCNTHTLELEKILAILRGLVVMPYPFFFFKGKIGT